MTLVQGHNATMDHGNHLCEGSSTIYKVTYHIAKLHNEQNDEWAQTEKHGLS